MATNRKKKAVKKPGKRTAKKSKSVNAAPRKASRKKAVKTSGKPAAKKKNAPKKAVRKKKLSAKKAVKKVVKRAKRTVKRTVRREKGTDINELKNFGERGPQVDPARYMRERLEAEARNVERGDERQRPHNHGPADEGRLMRFGGGERDEYGNFAYVANERMDEGMRGPQRGYVSSEVARHMTGQNGVTNPGGRSYGQNYGHRHEGGGFQPRGNRREEGYHNGQQDYGSAGRTSGDRFSQHQGQHRRGQTAPGHDNEFGRARHDESNDRGWQDRNDGEGQHPHHEYHGPEGYYRRSEFEDDLRREGDDHWREGGVRRFAPPIEDGTPWPDETELEFRQEGYQSAPQMEGFGRRQSKRRQGGLLGEEEYRGGHAHNHRGRGKYGSR